MEVMMIAAHYIAHIAAHYISHMYYFKKKKCKLYSPD